MKNEPGLLPLVRELSGAARHTSGVMKLRISARPITRKQTGLRGTLSALLLFSQLGAVSLPGNTAQAACAAPGFSGAGGTLTGVVNSYFSGPITASVTAGASSLSLGGGSGATSSIKVGDELLIIQMQGATVNSTNTIAYGKGSTTANGGTAYTAGLYEYVVATSSGAAGGSVSIRGAGTGGGTVNSYVSAQATATTPRRSYQVVLVPQYTTATLSSTLTAKKWDGVSGGVLAIDVAGKLTLSGTVDLSGFGFRGGGARALQGIGTAVTATSIDYVNVSTLNVHASKGEGTAGTPRYTYSVGDAAIVDNRTANGAANPEGYPNGSAGMGGPGNAGGGGTDGNVVANDQNSGGGGGGNAGIGGRGGNTWSSNLPRGGYGGDAMTYSVSRLFMGGGGGAGTRNNSAGFQSSGGSGGGMAFIRAGSLGGSGTLLVNGAVGIEPANDGGGGGGAGGTVLFYAAATTGATVTLTANGGGGSNTNVTSTGSPHGPGGGGGGGVILTNLTGASISAVAGSNGTAESDRQVYGAASGAVGNTSVGLVGANIVGLAPADGCTPVANGPTITKQQANVTNGTPLGTGPITVKPGQTIRYVLTASNSSYTTATSLTFRDPVPTTLTAPVNGTLTCPDGSLRTVTLGSNSVSVNVISACGMNLNPGQSTTLDFSVTVK